MNKPSHGQIVTVFGGSGFVGRHVVRALCRQGWRVRVASRRPHLAGDLKLAGDVGQVQLVQVNVRNRPSIERALDGAEAAINLVGLLHQHGRQSFQGTQTLGATNIAEIAAKAGVTRFVYVSAIGASDDSRALYGRTKAAAEAATLAALPTATIVRPSIIFGPEDGFFTRFAELSRMTPVMPLIGGETKFAPVFVGDVGAAVANALVRDEAQGKTFELGGPRTYTMAELLAWITKEIDRPRLMLPLPFFIAAPMGYIIGALSSLNPFFPPPLTGDQVQMLRTDNVPAAGAPGLAALGVANPETVEAVVPAYLWRHRPYGQFHTPSVDEVSRVDA